MQLSTLFLSLFAAIVVAQSPVTVNDGAHNLTYIGFNFQGTEQFQGINYGQDTSGANRFKPPKAFTYPTGTTIQATAAGPACPQNTILSFLGAISENPGVFNISEDCLSLEVVRPAATRQNANLPVMVYIYGQGFESGSYNYSLYNPTALVAGSAAKGTPVIFVAMNYRVNVFGFGNNAALRTEGSLNAGLLDQRLALEWIQSNIAVFGGNPRNVTIFGESDGATSVGLHLTSNGGNGRHAKRCFTAFHIWNLKLRNSNRHRTFSSWHYAIRRPCRRSWINRDHYRHQHRCCGSAGRMHWNKQQSGFDLSS